MSAQDISKFVAGFKDAIKDYEEAIRTGKDANAALERGLESAVRSANNFSGAIGSAATGLEAFSKLSISNTNSFGGLIDSIESARASFEKFAAGVKGIPIAGNILDPILGAFDKTAELAKTAAQATENFAKAYDGADKGTRENIATQFKYAAALGMTFDQAEKNNKAFQNLIATNSEFAQSGIYFGGEEFRLAVQNLQAAGISMDELSRASNVSSQGMNNVQMMTLQAKAMGMDVSEYSRKMADMIRKTGLSTEDSMKMMAGAQELSSETGLRLDEVTQSLEGVVGGFQRMGTTMDFGRPILKGFADSVKEVGLGIEQAKDLSSEFSKSLLGIVNNPALAYVTAMKGGFEGAMGGPGGVLNPSIQMQAMMLNQEPGSQAELARNLSSGIREMLTSTTGGEIVNVNQAAAGDASTQSRFTQQQMMLGSVYGISDITTQSRVLEYLQQQDEAMASGDDELVQKIDEQISNAIKGNDRVLDVQQKISQSIDKSLILLQEQVNLAKVSYGKPMEDQVMKLISEISDLSNQLIEDSGNEELKGKRDSKQLSLDMLVGVAGDAAKKAESGAGEPTDPGQPGSQTVGNKNVSKDLDNSPKTLNVVLTAPKDLRAEVTSGALSASGFTVNIAHIRN